MEQTKFNNLELTDEYPIELLGDTGTFDTSLEKILDEGGVKVFRFRLVSEVPAELPPFSLKWNLPAHDVKFW